ncbi:MAG: DMT family transporter [Chloroflexota bacterium]|nr:DMT family transporter [Chloroflexota bacterium]
MSLAHDARRSTRQRADLALLAVAAAWGATFVMVKDALDQVGPLTFVAFRFGLSAAAMLPFLRRPPRLLASTVHAGRGRLGRDIAGAGMLVGAFLFAGYALQTGGLQFTGAGRAGFITGLNVVIVPVLAATLGRQRIGRVAASGVTLAMAGLILLSLGDLAAEPLAINVGDLLVLGCAVAFALHILAVGRFAARHDVVGLAFTQIAAVAAFSTLAALIWEQPSLAALVAVWPAAAFTGLVCTVIAFTVQVQAQRSTSPTHTALVFSTEPVFAALFAYWLGGERFGPAELLGCALILLGMIVAQLGE